MVDNRLFLSDYVIVSFYDLMQLGYTVNYESIWLTVHQLIGLKCWFLLQDIAR